MVWPALVNVARACRASIGVHSTGADTSAAGARKHMSFSSVTVSACVITSPDTSATVISPAALTRMDAADPT
jgi:hypothetical protein